MYGVKEKILKLKRRKIKLGETRTSLEVTQPSRCQKWTGKLGQSPSHPEISIDKYDGTSSLHYINVMWSPSHLRSRASCLSWVLPTSKMT